MFYLIKKHKKAPPEEGAQKCHFWNLFLLWFRVNVVISFNICHHLAWIDLY